LRFFFQYVNPTYNTHKLQKAIFFDFFTCRYRHATETKHCLKNAT